MACGQKPLTLTLSHWERGQEAIAKKVIGNRARHALAVMAYYSVVSPYTTGQIKRSAFTALSAGVHSAQSDPIRFGFLSVL